MLMHYENPRSHSIVVRRWIHRFGQEAFPCDWYTVHALFEWLKPACGVRTPLALWVSVGNGPVLATTLLGLPACGTSKRSSPSRPYPQHYPERNSGSGRSHSTYHPASYLSKNLTISMDNDRLIGYCRWLSFPPPAFWLGATEPPFREAKKEKHCLIK
jgi:hypothetical protein